MYYTMEHTKELIERLGEGGRGTYLIEEVMDELEELIRLRKQYDTLVADSDQVTKDYEELKEDFDKLEEQRQNQEAWHADDTVRMIEELGEEQRKNQQLEQDNLKLHEDCLKKVEELEKGKAMYRDYLAGNFKGGRMEYIVKDIREYYSDEFCEYNDWSWCGLQELFDEEEYNEE
jgi:hypothetical protein